MVNGAANPAKIKARVSKTMNHGAHILLPLLLERGEGRGEESILFTWFIGRSFFINIDFGAEQDRRSPATANHRNISDSRMLMTGKFLARGKMLLIFGGRLGSGGISECGTKNHMNPREFFINPTDYG